MLKLIERNEIRLKIKEPKLLLFKSTVTQKECFQGIVTKVKTIWRYMDQQKPK